MPVGIGGGLGEPEEDPAIGVELGVLPKGSGDNAGEPGGLGMANCDSSSRVGTSESMERAVTADNLFSRMDIDVGGLSKYSRAHFLSQTSKVLYRICI